MVASPQMPAASASVAPQRPAGERDLEIVVAIAACVLERGHTGGVKRRSRHRGAVERGFGFRRSPRLVGQAAECDARGAHLSPVARHDHRDRNERERVGSAVAHLAIDLPARRRRRQHAPTGSVRPAPAPFRYAACCRAHDRARRSGSSVSHRRAPTVSTRASSAVIATAMSDGCAAMQSSLTPSTAFMRLKPAERRAARRPARACCRAWSCHRSRGTACAGAGCRRSSPCCEAASTRRPGSPATAAG